MAVAALFLLWFIPWVPKLAIGMKVSVTRWDKKHGETRAEIGPTSSEWIAIKSVSRHVLNAIVVAEDARFYDHHGLDLAEIAKSIETNVRKRRYARGGSTISQQVVKMAFLTREKSLVRKAREAVGALLMESIMSKDGILEWYINLAEFGDGVYGLKAASRHYFGTKPELLTIEQGIHLALVIPSPNGWSIGLRRKALTPFGMRRYTQILRQMRRGGYVTEALFMTTLSRGDFGRPLPAFAQHLPPPPLVSDVRPSPDQIREAPSPEDDADIVLPAANEAEAETESDELRGIQQQP